MEDHELKSAYEQLGLEADATKEEVEQRYFLLLKKAKHGGKTVDTAPLSQAYKVIMASEHEAAKAAYQETHFAKSEKREKWDHFWSYYKLHVAGAIVGIMLIVFAVNTYMEKRAERLYLESLPPAAVEVLLFGNFYSEQEMLSDEAIIADFPGWERISLKSAYVPTEITSEYDIALQQKGMITLISEKPDLFIVDRHNFEIMARQEAFVPLQEWFGVLPSSELVVSASLEEDGGVNVAYGLLVQDSALLAKLGVRAEEGIIAMRVMSERMANAKTFAEWALAQAAQ